MNADEFAQVALALGLGNPAYADALGVDVRMVRAYASGGRPIPRSSGSRPGRCPYSRVWPMLGGCWRGNMESTDIERRNSERLFYRLFPTADLDLPGGKVRRRTSMTALLS